VQRSPDHRAACGSGVVDVVRVHKSVGGIALP
jgi:hypothetical protein